MCGRDRTKKGVRWPLVLVPTTRPFRTNQGCAAEWVRRAFKAWLRPNLWLHQLHGLCVRPRSSRDPEPTRRVEIPVNLEGNERVSLRKCAGPRARRDAGPGRRVRRAREAEVRHALGTRRPGRLQLNDPVG